MLALASVVAVSLFVIAMILYGMDRRRRKGSSPAAKRLQSESLDTIEAWPPQVVRVMTLEERKAFELLRTAFPNHLVLAQVPLARFISVPTQNDYAVWLQRVGRLSVDLLVADSSSRPIAAVEVRKSVSNDRSKRRHARTMAVLQAAGIPVLQWTEDAMPTADEARDSVRKALAGQSELPFAAMPAKRPITAVASPIKTPALVEKPQPIAAVTKTDTSALAPSTHQRKLGAAANAASAASAASAAAALAAITTEPAIKDALAKASAMELDDERPSNLPLPVAEVHELLADGDDRFAGVQHEPVASTFFDDLDELEWPRKG